MPGVAVAADVSVVDYQLIEFGHLEPTQTQQQTLADALGIELSELLTDSEDYWHDYAQAVLSYAEPLTTTEVEACAQLLARTQENAL